MEVTISLHSSESTPELFNSLKMMFMYQEVDITIKTRSSETDYLLGNEANRKHLVESLEYHKNRENLTTFSSEEFEAFNQKLLNQ